MKFQPTDNPWDCDLDMVRIDGELRPVKVEGYWRDGYRQALWDVIHHIQRGNAEDQILNIEQTLLDHLAENGQ